MVKLLHMSWLGLYELVPLSYGALSPRWHKYEIKTCYTFIVHDFQMIWYLVWQMSNTQQVYRTVNYLRKLGGGQI